MLSPPNHPQGAPAPSLTPPFMLGQYRVVQKIGEGGMGSVYRALHPLLKKEFAVKVLPPEATADSRAVARFRREMEAIGRLDHHHIVRATDAGEAGGVHFLVMELVDGIDLSRLVRYCAPLPVADACELIRQAALGLQCAHEHGLVHRDVKPSNLVLSRKGEVKVLDLGLALLSRIGPGSGEMTVSGQAMGTADYMAPEQWQDSHDVDIRADVYSLGCTLYTFLVGRPPFAGGDCATPLRKMAAHAGAPILPAGRHRADVPAPLEALLARMVAKAPDDRPATPAEVARALEPFARGADLSALAARALALASPGLPAPHDRPTLPEAGRLVTPTPEAALAVTPSLVRRPSASGRRRALGVAAVVVLTAAVAVAFGLWRWSGNQPRPDGPTAPATAPADSRPGKSDGWQNLLASRPGERYWPPAQSLHLDYNSRKEVLWVEHPGLALVSLGTTDARAYKLQVGLRQSRWVGGFGVYFGGRPANDPQYSFQFQAIKLQAPQRINSRTFNLVLLFGHIEQKKSNHPPLVPYQGIDSSPLSRAPDPTEQLLELVVKPDGLATVRWNGELCPGVVTLHAAEQTKKIGMGCQGEFGIYCEASSVTVTTARFLPLE